MSQQNEKKALAKRRLTLDAAQELARGISDLGTYQKPPSEEDLVVACLVENLGRLRREGWTDSRIVTHFGSKVEGGEDLIEALVRKAHYQIKTAAKRDKDKKEQAQQDQPTKPEKKPRSPRSRSVLPAESPPASGNNNQKEQGDEAPQIPDVTRTPDRKDGATMSADGTRSSTPSAHTAGQQAVEKTTPEGKKPRQEDGSEAVMGGVAVPEADAPAAGQKVVDKAAETNDKQLHLLR